MFLPTAIACGALLIASSALGAAPADEAAGEAAIEETPIGDIDREHWSFMPLERPQLPAAASGWARNPIDRFIAARLHGKQIAPRGEADRSTLIRRLTLDLTGLPPTPEEVDAFVADGHPQAYEQLVERLLASPAFGEHYAQAWLDLARWAETDGFEHDKERPEAWRYRNWVIEALNRDLPYDQFLSLQLAGDEIRPGDDWALAATGFCLAGPDMPDINLQQERRHTVLNDLTSTVGSVFLGLQFGCAQCHDHKFDPISQADFYRLRAIFEPAVDFSGHVLREGKPKPKSSYLYVKGDFRRRGPEVQPAFPRVANVWGAEIEPPADGALSSNRRSQLAAWLTKPDHPLTSRVMANRLWQYHFGRGLSESPSDFGLMGDEPIYGQLLDWLAVELVEHEWSMKHIHRLIVTSATYRQASRPAAGGDPAWRTAVELDPRNLYWSRFPRRRLSGEALRDTMLAVGDCLDRTVHGESIRPPLPKEVVSTLLRPDHWKVSPSRADHHCRSVYVFARRNLRFPFFEAFDRPAATDSCPRRNTSTIAPQSLMLLNSEFSLEIARRLAGNAIAAGGDPEERIGYIFRRALSRPPSPPELADAAAFLAELPAGEPVSKGSLPLPMPSGMEPSTAAAYVDYCLAILNTSEFVYLE